MHSHSWSTNAPPLKTANQLLFKEIGQLSSHLITRETQSHRKWQHRKKVRWAQGQTHRLTDGPKDGQTNQYTDRQLDGPIVEYSHGSLPMNVGPGLCWEGGGLGVPTSLFLAILVLALANSSRRVWGISGSNRTPLRSKMQKNESAKILLLRKLLYSYIIVGLAQFSLYIYFFITKFKWYIFITLTKGWKRNDQIFWLWNGSKADRSKKHECHCWALGKFVFLANASWEL